MIKSIKDFFAKRKESKQRRDREARILRDQIRLTKAVKEIKSVCRGELPGAVIETEDDKYLIDDVVLSIRDNNLRVKKTLFSVALTKGDPRALEVYRERSTEVHNTGKKTK